MTLGPAVGGSGEGCWLRQGAVWEPLGRPNCSIGEKSLGTGSVMDTSSEDTPAELGTDKDSEPEVEDRASAVGVG